jgi:hypothetical protein
VGAVDLAAWTVTVTTRITKVNETIIDWATVSVDDVISPIQISKVFFPPFFFSFLVFQSQIFDNLISVSKRFTFSRRPFFLLLTPVFLLSGPLQIFDIRDRLASRYTLSISLEKYREKTDSYLSSFLQQYVNIKPTKLGLVPFTFLFLSPLPPLSVGGQ